MNKTGLSEQELLLLANYEYFYCSTSKGTIQSSIDEMKNPDGSFDIGKVISQGATGDIISEDDAVDILRRLEADENLSSLRVARSIDRGGIRATLYANADDTEATVVFRGTGGTYKAWEDNVLGEYQSDTRLQKLAADFVKYECGAYEHITVTGHSKGGNMSQYVTVVCDEQVDRCVSFDGQGFGSSFLESHKDEIERARSKITSISGYNDFVNILLTPIAGSVLYVKNQEGLGVDMHSCYTMLSNGYFNEDGSFNRDFGVVPQMHLMSVAKKAGDEIVSLMEMLPKDGNEKAANILGAMTAAVFSADRGEEYEKDQINGALKEFKTYAGQLVGISAVNENSVNYGCDFLFMNVENMRAVYSEFDEATNHIAYYPELLEDVLSRLDYSILGRSFTDIALRRIINRTEELYRSMNSIRGALSEIIRCYEKADSVL